MRIFHETRMRGRKGPTASEETSLAEGRLGHVQDVLIIAIRYAVGNGCPGLGSLMGNTQFLRSGNELTGIVGINLLDLPSTTEPLKCLPGRLESLVLDRDTSDKGRIQIFDVDCILISSDAVLLTTFSGHQVVCCDDFTSLFGIPLTGANKMTFGSHLALAAVFTILVERLVS